MRPRFVLLLLLLLTLTAALCLPAAASATIVPQKGMAGVRIGMTKVTVRGILGQPLRVVHGMNDFGPYTEFRYPNRIRITFQGDLAVTAASTTGRAERTAGGVGVGSTETEVKAGVAHVRCETFGAFRDCYVGSYLPGRRVTAFSLKNGLVTRVTVGIVID